MLESASSISVAGKDRVRSIARPMNESTQPPVKPAMMPSTAPTQIEIRVAERAMASEKVRPYQTRESTSRPVWGSTPSGWSQLMPPSFPVGRPPEAGSVSSWWKVVGSSTPIFTRNGAEIAARM